MASRSPAPVVLAAVVLVGLVAVDHLPVMRGAPLLLLTVMGAIQIGRELAGLLARRRAYPSVPVINFTIGLTVCHLAYYRVQPYSTLLELVMTVALALFTLVFVAAVAADFKLHGPGAASRDLILAVLITLVVGGGLSCGLLLQTVGQSAVTADGSRLVALVLAASWLAWGLGRVGDRQWHGALAGTTVSRLKPSLYGDLGRLGGGLAGLLIGWSALRPEALPGLLPAALVGLLVGAGAAVGARALWRLASLTEVDSTRYHLPRQVGFLQPIYEKLYPGGLTDFAGFLTIVLPLVYCAVRLMNP